MKNREWVVDCGCDFGLQTNVESRLTHASLSVFLEIRLSEVRSMEDFENCEMREKPCSHCGAHGARLSRIPNV